MDIVRGVHGKCQVVIQSFLVFGQIFDSVCVFSGKQKKTVLSRKCSAISYNSPHQKFYLSRLSILYYGHKVVNHRKEVITLTVIPRCLPM